MSTRLTRDWLDQKAIKQAYKPHLACVGEALIELSGLNFQTHSAGLKFAGDTMNTAVYLKRCLSPECEVSYVTALGQDAISNQMVVELSGHGLGTAHIGRRENLLPGIYAIELDDKGERSFRYWRNQSAAKSLFAQGSPTLDDLGVFDAVYFSGISLAILPDGSKEILLGKLAELRSKGCLVIFDTNYRPALWTNPAEAAKWFDQVWQVTDLALPSIEDLEAIYPNSSADTFMSDLTDAGVKEVVLRRGEKPPYLFSESSDYNGQVYAPTAPKLEAAPAVVDTTGAGDSFNGAYIAARLKGLNAEQAVLSGHQQALKVIAQTGAIIPIDTDVD